MRVNMTIAVVLAGLLSGCSTHPDIQGWAKESSKGIKPGIEKIPEMKVYTPSTFSPAETLVSPFNGVKIEPDYKKGTAGGPDYEAREKRNNELERYPLEAFTMVGSFKLKGAWMGLISFDGKTQQVKPGQYIGMDFGIVKEVTDSEITVMEQVEDTTQGWVERKNSLLLQKTKEEPLK